MRNRIWTVALLAVCLSAVTAMLIVAAPAEAEPNRKEEKEEEKGCGAATKKCHAKEYGDLKASVHGREEKFCTDCHDGGDRSAKEADYTTWRDWRDAAHKVDSETEKVKAPSRKTGKVAILKLCGKCHETPLHDYRKSKHGSRLMLRGDDRVAICIDCHGTWKGPVAAKGTGFTPTGGTIRQYSAHQIRPVSDSQSAVYPSRVPMTCGRCHDGKYGARNGVKEKAKKEDYPKGTPLACMKCHMPAFLVNTEGVRKPLPATKFHQYAASVHGEKVIGKEDISAPTCVKCHSAHAAMPPKTKDIKQVCANCHKKEREHLDKGPHKKAMAKKKLHYCVECHGGMQNKTIHNHFIRKPSEGLLLDSCSKVACHVTEASRRKAVGVGRELYEMLDLARKQVSEMKKRIDRAVDHGVEVDKMEAHYAEAKNQLTGARPVVHALDLHSENGVVARMKKIDEAYRKFDDEFERLREREADRRALLWPILVLVFVSILAIGLKIRQFEAAHKKQAPEEAKADDGTS